MRDAHAQKGLSRPDFTRLIREDLKPSLGVSEPGAIALAVSRARSLTRGAIRSVLLEVNSGIYKNAFTCGIPNTNETGNLFAAALGAVAGDWTRGLAALDGVGEAEAAKARELVAAGGVRVKLRKISSDLYLKATVRTGSDRAEVTIRDSHANITRIVHNGKAIPAGAEKTGVPGEGGSAPASLAGCRLADFWDYARRVPGKEIGFIWEAYKLNLALMEEGVGNSRAVICKELLAENGGGPVSGDPLRSAHAMTAAAIEARVRGLGLPAMSITGSGNHGIICTLPLYARVRAGGGRLPRLKLLRATALSHLVTMFIKEHSGKLSAFCGCAVAAGTGTAAGWLFLAGGDLEQAGLTINNMASGLAGVICTGGNPACVLKAAAALDLADKAVRLALRGLAVEPEHGINGDTPEQTMRNIGRIACPGMTGTEKTILEIMEGKSRRFPR
ncbi:MAG: L-serine ammonia-lyase, iron-sulfur-dependent, subunit alpha [Planctomycetota bacterium]|jgi:L-cysteine desulfidase|nr:L-serine ammonia-lyase, iron-sulfur-dependent, subunit alpha [Planctomycetota bacterium]